MPAAPEQLIEIGVRHQTYLEGLKTQQVNDLQKFLRETDRAVSRRLAGKDLTGFTRKRLERLVSQVRQDLTDINGDMTGEIRQMALDLADYESGFEIRSLKQVVDFDFDAPTMNQLRSAVLNNPLSARGPDQGKLLTPFMKDWTDRQSTSIANAIRSGYYEGQTTNQILQTIRGTRARGFNDGILATHDRGTKAMVRTALQHSAVQAREATWNQNRDIVRGRRISATLDMRTTDICMSLDGQVFPLDSGPKPPFHISCRTTETAALDERFSVLDEGATRFSRGADGIERVPAKETYFSWLKRQPKDFQNSVIGPTRGKLLRDGGLTSERFAELQLNRNFKPLTLDRIRELEPVAFERAGM